MYNKELSKEERNYCVTRTKSLAIIRALEHFHKYLYGKEFSPSTDHAALVWLLSLKIWKGCKNTTSRYNISRDIFMIMQMTYPKTKLGRTMQMSKFKP